MKLYLRLLRGIWCCRYEDAHGLPILPWGHGYTRAEAYAEWRQANEASA